MDERDLVESACRGERPAMDALFERHLPGLRAFVRLRMGPTLRAREGTEDLAQSVCREILEHIDRFCYQGEAEFRNWLYKEALRKIANRAEFQAAQKRDVAREARPAARIGESDARSLSHVYQTLHTPSQDLAAREQAERIERAFDKLTEDQRQVILLAKVVGLSHARIAEEMGKSEGATRVLLHRALLRLAEVLEEGG